MSATSYETTVVVYVRHLGGGHLPISADQGVDAVKRAFDGNMVELIPGKLYTGHDSYGTPVVLTGFEKFTSAVKRDHLVITNLDDDRDTYVVPIVVTINYDVPWGVSNVAGKAWEQIIATLRGEDTRWGKFLSVSQPLTTIEYLGSDGKVLFWVSDTTNGYIDSLLDDVFRPALPDADEEGEGDLGDSLHDVLDGPTTVNLDNPYTPYMPQV